MSKSGVEKLLEGSFVLFITINLFNAFNFIYNILMARSLSLVDYGTLTVLLYFIIVTAIFSESIQTVVARYCNQEGETGKVKNIIKRSLRKTFFLCSCLFLALALAAIFISPALHVSYSLLMLSGLMIFFTLLPSVTRGALQGKKNFLNLGLNLVSEGLIKLVLAIIFVTGGFALWGAMGAVVIAAAVAFLLSLVSLRKTFSEREQVAKTPQIYAYTRPVFVAISSIIIFLSLDIFMVRLFFPLNDVGAYAIAATIAKIIFVITQPLGKAMFPLSVENKEKKDSRRIFGTTFILLLLFVVGALAIFYFVPSFVISLYSGRLIPLASEILFPLGIAMGILSFTNVSILYGLSRGSDKNYYFLPLFVIIQVAFAALFHNTLLEFSWALVASSATFLLGCVIALRR